MEQTTSKSVVFSIKAVHTIKTSKNFVFNPNRINPAKIVSLFLSLVRKS